MRISRRRAQASYQGHTNALSAEKGRNDGNHPNLNRRFAYFVCAHQLPQREAFLIRVGMNPCNIARGDIQRDA
jgi:hypothetical protein